MRFKAKFTAFLLLFVCGCREDASLDRKTVDSDRSKPIPPFRSFFPCLDGVEGRKRLARTASLKGPDWELKSTIQLNCLPERSLDFSSTIQNPLLPRQMVTRTKMWVTKKNDQIYVRVLESGGSEEQQLTAIGFVTNQSCTQITSRNCHILLSPPARID
jgi:hypothetical protein